MEGSELLQTFERELRQSTELLQSLLLEAEQKKNFGEVAPLLQEAYRLAHSLKGASRVVGLFSIGEIAHALEDQLQRLLRDQILPGSREISTFLRVDEAFQAAFDAFLNGEMFESESLEQELRSLQIAGSPAVDPPPPPVIQKPEVQDAPENSAELDRPRREELMMVPSRQIDDLFRRMEEAFLIESRITALLTSTDNVFQQSTEGTIPEAWQRQYGQLRNEASRLHFVLMHFHDIVRLFRMVPLKRLRMSVQKAVRDLSITLSKPVAFQFYGEDQMVDASVLESLMDPVTHIVRNALDHGIETPRERVEKGKPLEGSVKVDVIITGGFLNLTIADDGRGISREKILQRATEMQWITEEEAGAFKEDAWLELLFRPGFSTAQSVSSISGRGLGMDIVRRRIQDLGGHLQIATRPGIGTTFHVQVPIGLLTPRVLLVRCGDFHAGIPISDIERVFAYDPASAQIVNGTTMLNWNHTSIQLESLAAHLGWYSSGTSSHVVLLSRNGIHKGFLVDEIVGEIEQVAFPPPWNLRGLPYLSAVIVMGNGELVPVMESTDLMQKIDLDVAVKTAREVPAPERPARTLLLVDDSPTIVALHRSVLKNAGYRVLTAENGLAAWNLMQESRVDLLLTDVEMPVMTGLDLIRRVRGDSSRKNLPIIVISQYGSSEDLQKAANAGADRYIVKSEFQPQKLLEVIAELLME